MAEHTFTPGPWDYWADPIEGIYRIRHEIDGGANRIIVGYAAKEVDAQLITAAPAMLEALKALRLQALQSNVNSPANEWGREALAMANAAIAAATGEIGEEQYEHRG